LLWFKADCIRGSPAKKKYFSKVSHGPDFFTACSHEYVRTSCKKSALENGVLVVSDQRKVSIFFSLCTLGYSLSSVPLILYFYFIFNIGKKITLFKINLRTELLTKYLPDAINIYVYKKHYHGDRQTHV